MAAVAKIDQQNRITEVNRLKLVETLIANRDKHIKDYEEAVAGYKEMALKRLADGYEEAKAKLEQCYIKAKQKIDKFDPENGEFRDYITLVDAVNVALKVPRSYVKEYDQAIDMAKWDVNETLKLTYAEFQCFVRDEWEWKREFDIVKSIYSLDL